MVVVHFGMFTPSIYKSRRRRSIIGVSPSLFASLACLFLLVQSARAQQIGVDVCACQPSVYEFTFDFELACDDQSVGGAGITDTTCLTELRGEQNQEDADLLPVAVGQVSIFELDQNLDVIAQTVNTGLFLSGSTFTYTSIIATEPELLDPASLPRGIQLVFIGVNALNQAIVNTFAILYNNDCGVFPLLRVGQQAGWIIFTDLGNPPEEVCPIAAEPSSSPSASKTTRAPVLENAPTASPSIVTEAPVSPGATASPMASDEPSSVPVLQPSATAPPSIIICPSGKRRGKGKSKVVKGKSNYEKKRKEHSERKKGHSKLSIDSGKKRGSPSGASEDTHGKGKGSSTKSNGDASGKDKGSRVQSNKDSYEEGRTDSGRGVSGKGKRIEQKQKDGSYGAMSRIGRRHHSEERLLGIGRVDYQNKNSGGTSKTSNRPSPFEPISGDIDENASGDIVDDSDGDNYDDDNYEDDDDVDDEQEDDDDVDDDQEDDDFDDDDYPECIEPDFASKSGGGKGKGTAIESSKSGGKGKGAPSKTKSSKAASTKASSGKGASTKTPSSKGSSTKTSPSKGSSTKISSTKGASSKASPSKGASTKASSVKGKGKGRPNDTGNSGKGKGQSKGTVSGSTRRRGRNKRHRSSQRDSKPMNKLQKGGSERFRDLMEQEYLSYWGS